MLLAAETGCGKTLAYLLPLVQQIVEWRLHAGEQLNSPLGIVITPSRELALQIAVSLGFSNNNASVNAVARSNIFLCYTNYETEFTLENID